MRSTAEVCIDKIILFASVLCHNFMLYLGSILYIHIPSVLHINNEHHLGLNSFVG